MASMIKDIALSLRQVGFRSTVRRYGWRVVACIFVYYLIRDSLIYILIPLTIASLAK